MRVAGRPSKMTDQRRRLGPITTASLVDKAYQEIRRGILSGQFAPGDRLVIDTLARDLGVSLGPVREALARLLSDRMAEFEPNRGYRVSPMPSFGDVKLWQEARLVIECGTVAYAAALADPDAVASLGAINDAIASSEFGPGHSPVVAFMELNAAFHRRIFEIAGNPILSRMYDQMSYGPQVTRQLTRTGVDDKVDIVREHAAIVAAIAAADGERARTSMQAHILDSLERSLLREGRAERRESPAKTNDAH